MCTLSSTPRTQGKLLSEKKYLKILVCCQTKLFYRLLTKIIDQKFPQQREVNFLNIPWENDVK